MTPTAPMARHPLSANAGPGRSRLAGGRTALNPGDELAHPVQRAALGPGGDATLVLVRRDHALAGFVLAPGAAWDGARFVRLTDIEARIAGLGTRAEIEPALRSRAP